MSINTRRELANSLRLRYQAASKEEKGKLLDEFVAATGYNRKHATVLLGKGFRERLLKRVHPRRKTYDDDVRRPLVEIWKVAGEIAAKRLVPGIPDLLGRLENCTELRVTPTVQAKLLSISAATCDRLLAGERRRHGKATTKPGTLLKHSVPIRTFMDWNECEKRPGFCEIDLVAHCGSLAAGDFAFSLTLVDVQTGWCENQSLMGRNQQATLSALQSISRRLPFPLLGLDSDNGTEFLNGHLTRWCEKEQITYTRSRPYKKNDQCYVEQKNWTTVRQQVGYNRYDTEESVELINRIYRACSDLNNFFLPSQKLIAKERDGGRVRKRHDVATTPYRRLLACPDYPQEAKEELTRKFEKLNPAQLRRRIERHQKALLDLTAQRHRPTPHGMIIK